MKKQYRAYSWPYPKHIAQLIQVTMVTMALIFAGLWVTAARYKAYRNQQLEASQLQQAAKTLGSFATEAGYTVRLARDRRITANFREVYSAHTAELAGQTVSFLQTHRAQPGHQAQAQQIAADGTALVAQLEVLARPADDSALKAAAAHLSSLEQHLQATEDSL
jgi:hypothetical protein